MTMSAIAGARRSGPVSVGVSGGDPLTPWIPMALAILLGLAAGWTAVRTPDALHLRPSPLHAAVMAVVLLAALPIVRRPALGLVALVLLVYLHLSDVLIRFHEFPSLLHLLAMPLLLALLVEWRRGTLKRPAPPGVIVALAAYVLVFIASSAVAEEPALADGRAAAAAKGFALFIAVLLLANTSERVRAGIWAVVAGGALLSGISLLQVATGAFDHTFGGLARVEHAHVYGDVLRPRIAGPLGDPNFFARILVIAVPLALLLAWKERTRRSRLLALAAAAIIAAAALLTYSRGGALALGAVGLCSLFAAHPSRRRVTLGAAGLLLAVLLLLPADFGRRLVTLRQLLPGPPPSVEMDSSLQNRVLQARVAWRMFLDHPALGVGAGNYTVHYYEYADEVGSTAPEYELAGGPHYPHNLYLELASETGLPGLLIFGTALLLVFGHLYRAEAAYFRSGDELHAALATGLAIAVLGFLLASLFLHGHFERHLWILLGLSAALAREAPSTPAPEPPTATPAPKPPADGPDRTPRRSLSDGGHVTADRGRDGS